MSCQIAGIEGHPAAVCVSDFRWREASFVLHGAAPGNVIAEINIRKAEFAGPLNQAKNAPCAEGALAIVGVMIKVNTGITLFENIDVTDGDELVVEIIRPLLDVGRSGHEVTDLIGSMHDVGFFPTLLFCVVRVVPHVQFNAID